MHWRRKWQPTPVFLPGEPQGRESLVGCRLWGHTVGCDWSDLAAIICSVFCITKCLWSADAQMVRLVRLTSLLTSWKFCLEWQVARQADLVWEITLASWFTDRIRGQLEENTGNHRVSLYFCKFYQNASVITWPFHRFFWNLETCFIVVTGLPIPSVGCSLSATFHWSGHRG